MLLNPLPCQIADAAQHHAAIRGYSYRARSRFPGGSEKSRRIFATTRQEIQ
jgi:hypothetical protein